MPTALFKSVKPVLPVRSVPEACRYYVDRLGFKLLFADHPNAPKYAGITRGGAELHLQWHDPVDFRENVDTPMLRFEVDDPDALYDEYRHKDVFHGGTALRDTEWGAREFAFYDLDGNGLTFYRRRS